MAKTEKNCIVCGVEFKGTAKAQVCGATCRQKLKRLLAKGSKPTFALVAKVKENNKPENRKIILKERNELMPKIDYKQPDQSAYDGEKLNSNIIDEPDQWQKPKEIDRMNNNFWNELRKKKLGIKD